MTLLTVSLFLLQEVHATRNDDDASPSSCSCSDHEVKPSTSSLRDSKVVSNKLEAPFSKIITKQEDHHDERSRENRRKRRAEKESRLRSKSYPELLVYFKSSSSRYFVCKSNCRENIEIAKKDGIWSTFSTRNRLVFDEAFKSSRNVIVFFSVSESGCFCGVARLTSGLLFDETKLRWIPSTQGFDNSFFKLDWICKKSVDFRETNHLRNSYNQNKAVKIARDGQEVNRSTAEALLSLFPQDSSVNLIGVLKTMKKQVIKMLHDHDEERRRIDDESRSGRRSHEQNDLRLYLKSKVRKREPLSPSSSMKE